MSALRDAIQANAGLWLAIGGFGIGALFGGLVYRTNFCAMGAISDIVNLDDWRRMRAWLLAAATALLGAQLLDWSGVVELKRSMYLAPSFNWLGNAVGGLMFGVGMVFAGGCASRNLARAGGGDLRALLTLLVLGIFAYVAVGGLLGPLRSLLDQSTSLALPAKSQSLGDIAAYALGLRGDTGSMAVTAVVVLAVAAYCFGDAEFRSSPAHIAAGLGIGVCAVLGWALTGLAFDEFADRPVSPISLTYVRPTGDAIEWMQRFTAARMPSFGVASVFGAIFGSFVAAKSMGRFRLTTFVDTSDTARCLTGAALMGVGGVMALGCTVGQAITGVSTLALGSFVTFVALVMGGILGVKVLERWLLAEG